MRFAKLVLISLVLCLTGCASGVKFSEMGASLKTLQADQGRVYFFRSASMVGAAIQPNIYLDDAVVGTSKPGGFFYVDIAPGPHKASTTTEVENHLTFVIDRGETKYVRTSPSLGFFVGHITPELVSPDEAKPELQGLSYTGTVMAEAATPAPVAKANPVAAPSAPAPLAPVAPATPVAPMPIAARPAPRPAPAPASVAAPQVAANTPFTLGVSSNTVERLAQQYGCESDRGASLVSEPGPVETYREQCRNGQVFIARCEMRQCSPAQ